MELLILFKSFALFHQKTKAICRQKGLSERTIYKCCTFVDTFLNFKFGESPDDLSKITGMTLPIF
jgi:integrase/recombinase XerD